MTSFRQGILTVQQLTSYVKELLDSDPVLQEVVVAGEISNFTHHSSGHMYFSLKDDSAAIRSVMFRSANRHLRFEPEGGLRVIARGYVSVYERTGMYQLYVQQLEPDGLGALHLAYEQLKKRLEEEGLFDALHKRALPSLPRRIGVVTSDSGAALRDIVNVSRRRFPDIGIVVVSTRVQGPGAAEEIASAIRRANRYGKLDVLIVGRGGGSIEDLWAFNEETVARAIFESELPVVSAVGHETDFTISDFVADLRAPTPSAAAELVVPQFQALNQRTAEAREKLRAALLREAQRLRERVDRIQNSRVLLRPQELVDQKRQYTDELLSRLRRLVAEKVRETRSDWRVAVGKLQALSPLGVLARGFAVCEDARGQIIRSSASVAPGESLTVWLHQGSLDCKVTSKSHEAQLLEDGAQEVN